MLIMKFISDWTGNVMNHCINIFINICQQLLAIGSQLMGDEFEDVKWQKRRINMKPIFLSFTLIFYEGTLEASLEYSELYAIFITKFISC